MKKNHDGFILLAVLVFLQIFSLFCIYSFLNLSASLKVNHHLWQGTIYRLKAQAILQELEGKFLDYSECFISMTPSIILAKKPLEWWQSNTCHDKVNGIRYYYAIEDLGEDACAVVGKQIARYYRINFYALPERLKTQRYLLQTTVIKSVMPHSTCTAVQHEVREGRQAWREL